jgi:hypothetical protein
MGERIGQWLVGQFALFGVPFQNWMAVALVIVVFGIAVIWFGRRSDDRE